MPDASGEARSYYSTAVEQCNGVYRADVALPHPLPDPIVELIARRFRVLGEATRIRILDRLREGEANVQELTDLLGTSQQNVSKHLGVLYDAGILQRRKEGTSTFYWILDESVLAVCEHVCGGLQQQFAELSRLVGGPLE